MAPGGRADLRAAGSRRRAGAQARCSGLDGAVLAEQRRTPARRPASPAAARAPSRASAGRGSRRRRRAPPARRRRTSVPDADADARAPGCRRSASREQVAGDVGRTPRPSPTKQAGSASSGPATSSATTHADDRPPAAGARGGPAGRRPRRRRARRLPSTRPRASARPRRAAAARPRSTSIGSSLTSAQSADVRGRRHRRVGGELAVRRRSAPAPRGAVRYSISAIGVRAVVGALDEPDARRGWCARRRRPGRATPARPGSPGPP